MELALCRPRLYRVKRGQTIELVARAFSLPPRLLAAENALSREIEEGQILKIPRCTGNLYTVRGGETKELLCGSEERFFSLNRTAFLYPTQSVLL